MSYAGRVAAAKKIQKQFHDTGKFDAETERRIGSIPDSQRPRINRVMREVVANETRTLPNQMSFAARYLPIGDLATKEQRRAYRHERRALISMAGGSFTVGEWLDLCAKYDDRCACCGSLESLTADHVIPVTLGGNSDISNIQPLCRSCNSRKGTRKTDYRRQA